jgi:hypothetical protein
MTVHVVAVPEHAPDHPPKLVMAFAVNVIVVAATMLYTHRAVP